MTELTGSAQLVAHWLAAPVLNASKESATGSAGEKRVAAAAIAGYQLAARCVQRNSNTTQLAAAPLRPRHTTTRSGRQRDVSLCIGRTRRVAGGTAGWTDVEKVDWVETRRKMHVECVCLAEPRGLYCQ